jgi:hypothetical protein
MSALGPWRRMAGAAALALVLYVGLLLLDFEPDPLRLTLLVLVGVAGLGLLADGLGNEDPSWTVDMVRWATPPGQDHGFATYVRMIEGHLTVDVPHGALRDRLGALAARRLEQRHGLSVDDPRAVALLGRELAAVLAGPPRRLGPAEIDRCVRRIEEL